ncbi:hypothetical protein, partial [Myxacorys almedinensis]|uniref:hypothetical protein n=1 Tax=Myxacorys almedinensis TaxID=2651157 RepID=UPI001EE3F6D1
KEFYNSFKRSLSFLFALPSVRRTHVILQQSALNWHNPSCNRTLPFLPPPAIAPSKPPDQRLKSSQNSFRTPLIFEMVRGCDE